jgi:hypothetical protein
MEKASRKTTTTSFTICNWEHVEEHFEKLKELMGTAWHSFENLVSTQKSQIK